ncbi:MAG TPA: PIG-L family deacetylase [Bryobacteraceae bacterium]|nr:PIG-L family deacetylase [Bryobacteraceae bacterium]
MAPRYKRLAVFLPAVAASVAALLLPARGQRLFPGEIEMRQSLQRLNTLASVMMIGAHPDDDREVLIAWLARGRHARTAYLSLTRGEGGQNLIGPEQGDELGIIRTQELLASRRIDGGEQYFTRAIDFGFSKTAAETLTKWPREKVLGDVVYNIRRFRPDVIVLCFTGTPRDGHGHHQVSAILGKEAFAAAADPTKFPEQLAYVQPWQAKRILENPFGLQGGPNGGNAAGKNAGKNADKELDKEFPPQDRLEIDVGDYSPELGYSYGEIGSMSRSANRSQGQGSAERKGSQKTYLVTIAGDKAKKDIFDGIDTTWNRLPGGAPAGSLLKQALDSFVPAHPEALLPLLAQARAIVTGIVNKAKDPLAAKKLEELDEAMALASALSLEAQASSYAVTPGANLRVSISAVARTPAPVTLTGVKLSGMEGAPELNLAPAVLAKNQPSQYTLNVRIPEDQPYSQPYWLELPKDGNLYAVRDSSQIGLPENSPVLQARFTVKIAGQEIVLTRPVQYRYTDPVYGDLIRPLAVVPPVAVELTGRSIVFPDNHPRQVEVPVKSNAGKASGDARLETPAGWKAEPASRHFDLSATGEQAMLAFELTPPATPAQGRLRAVAQIGARNVAVGAEIISYPHFPVQTLFPAAEASLVRADIKTLSRSIGYVMGAGDEVPATLQQIGCTVALLTSTDLSHGDLARFDAIVTGVRAWNVRPDLRANYQRLFDYVSNGGTLIVQYNRAEGPGGRPGQAPQAQAKQAPQAARENAQAKDVKAAPSPANAPAGEGGALEHIGPFPIHISNDRVTDEDAAVTFPNPRLALLHQPNEITPADFQGWVQERGLNFADQWDPKYLSVLESHDPGEDPHPGGMLYVKYGKGAYIFSAYDWFRELPAGVPGAYRLFANMLSAAKTQQ